MSPSGEIQAQIAKELTLSIVDKIRATDTTSNDSMNESLAQEVASAYAIILKKVKELT